MNWRPERAAFRCQLLVWALRGGFCALPSFSWAVLAMIPSPLGLLGMPAGVVTFVLAYAWLAALPLYRERVAGTAFGWALGVGANTRAALAPLMFFGPDTALGVVALQTVARMTRQVGVGDMKMQADFFTVYLTTLVQGALVSATMFLLVLPLWGSRLLWLRRK